MEQERNKPDDADTIKDRKETKEHPEETAGGTGTLPEGGVPNPGVTSRGD
jgi:hypothetical protein